MPIARIRSTRTACSFRRHRTEWPIEAVIYDVFMRPMKLERVELSWDGQRMSIRSLWESGETLSAADYYSGKR